MTDLFIHNIVPLFQWTIRTSIAIGIIISCILLMKFFLKSKLKPIWHYLIWLVVMIKCILPWSPESTYSIFNLIRPLTSHQLTSSIKPERLSQASFYNWEKLQTAQTTLTKGTGFANTSTAGLSPQPHVLWTLSMTFTCIWIAGILVGLIYLWVVSRRFQQKIKEDKKKADNAIMEILTLCKKKMGIKRHIPVYYSQHVKSPAIVGYVKPILLLPEALNGILSPEEWQHIFLHELSHVKKHDIAINWLSSFLVIMHWFNPLVWVAYRCMRMDQEIVCDAQALSCLERNHRKNYGHTMIRLIEICSGTLQSPGTAQLLGNKRLLIGRVKMIKSFKKQPVLWSIVALLLVAGIAVVTMTSAKTLMQSHKNTTGLKSHSSANNTTSVSTDSTGKIPDKKLLQQIEAKAQMGKVPLFVGDIPYFEFGVHSSSINDVKKLWGAADKTDQAGQGTYSTYNNQKAAFGFNKDNILFDVRSYGAPLQKIHQSEVQKVLGLPNDVRHYDKEAIWDYQVSPTYHLLFIFLPETKKMPDPVIDHLSVFSPADAAKGTRPSPLVSKTATPSSTTISHKTVIQQFVTAAKKGRVPFYSFTLNTSTIQDVEKDWGKPATTNKAGKGIYSTFDSQGAAIGYNKNDKIFDIRIYTGIIKKIDLSDIINVLGKSEDIRYYKQQIIWVYHVNRNNELEFILPKPTSQQPDPTVDHISVFSESAASK